MTVISDDWDDPFPLTDPLVWELGLIQPAIAPRIASGRLILNRLVVDPCPHCGGRHRHRFQGWDRHYPAICAADGGYIVQHTQHQMEPS